MVHMNNKFTLLKKIVFAVILVYSVITVISQQKILNTYKVQAKTLDGEIAEATEYQEHLNQEKENINSSEYIDDVARKKLDMYLSNERVYIDSEN